MSEPDKPGQEAHAGYYDPEHPNEEPMVPRLRRARLPAEARCVGCGCAELSTLPTFSVGMGLAHRPLAEDVFCRRCGHIGLPTLAGMPPEMETDSARARGEQKRPS